MFICLGYPWANIHIKKTFCAFIAKLNIKNDVWNIMMLVIIISLQQSQIP